MVNERSELKTAITAWNLLVKLSLLFSNEWFWVDNSLIHLFVNEISLVKNDETDEVWNGILPNAKLEIGEDGVELVVVVDVDVVVDVVVDASVVVVDVVVDALVVGWAGVDDALVVSKIKLWIKHAFIYF